MLASRARQSRKEVKLIEKAIASLGISKAAVKANAGTKTAVVTHLSTVKADRCLALRLRWDFNMKQNSAGRR